MIATARATEPPNANKASTVELDHTPLALLIGIEDLSPDGRKQRHHLMPGDYISDVLA
jgi:hypothetical protein